MNQFIIVTSVVWCTYNYVAADIYMHHPAGSNNRNRERTRATQNENRLYDSQNNQNGEYPWRGDRELTGKPDAMLYYQGSILRIEWTLQHSCGPDSNARCDVILQYACEDQLPALRDGYPTGALTNSPGNNGFQEATFQTNNPTGTNTIPMPNIAGSSDARFPASSNLDTNTSAQQLFYNGEQVDGKHGIEYGLHESYDYYKKCLYTERNQGLYTADRKLGGTSARFTRQNNGGTRYGFECPEERDYYPYWRSSPWIDIAILTSDESSCAHYRETSQNVQSRYECKMPSESTKLAPINKASCTLEGGTWIEIPPNRPNSRYEPECIKHSISRDNHLGNVGGGVDGRPETAHYNWKIPFDHTNQHCVIRMRYNISTGDFKSRESFHRPSSEFADWKLNCKKTYVEGEIIPQGQEHCGHNITTNTVPLINRPYIQLFGLPPLGIAMNTNQAIRTFQSRSYVFKIVNRPNGVSSDVPIYNLNVRGKRGNIVDVYPSVEYDFVPSHLTIEENALVHLQFTGSDFNVAQNPNDGEGWQYSDRFNLVQTANHQSNFPLHPSKMTMLNAEMAKRIAFSDQDPLTCSVGRPDDNNAIDNCAKLNRAKPHLNFGLLSIQPGDYHYVSTRNNNFSNRSQKGFLRVLTKSVSTLVIAVAVTSSVVALSAAGVAGYAIARPHSPFGNAVRMFCQQTIFRRLRGKEASPESPHAAIMKPTQQV